MNKIDRAKRVNVIRCLVEGCSIRSTVRMTGVAKNTVSKLLVQMGEVCRAWHDQNIRGLKTARIQCDEIWSFVGCKQKSAEQGKQGMGDIWTWVALDADTKLAVTWLLGERDGGTAFDFMHDLAGRLIDRVQITTDGLYAYIDAVFDNFGPYADFAQLVKLFGDDPRLKRKNPEAKYSPSHICGCYKRVRSGDPDPKHVSTSFVERHNLTMRMSMRRFTRLTNAFSRKVANHEAAVSLYFAHYNLCRVHKSLKVTPAMEAGITDHVWSIEELVGLLEQQEQAAIKAGAMKRGKYGPRNSN